MNNQYFAKPYNGDVSGFYFTDYADYSEQVASLVDSYGEPVDELELYFIDGDNAQLFNAIGINQANLEQWFNELESLGGEELIKAIYLAEFLNVDMSNIPDQLDEVSLFEGRSDEYAEEYITDSGLLDDMPENLRYYFDVEAFARDMLLSGDINEVEIMGTTYVAWGC